VDLPEDLLPAVIVVAHAADTLTAINPYRQERVHANDW
jgi:hypothetical protein